MSRRLLPALLFLMLSLSGCAGFDEKHLDRGKPLKVPDDEALVFGKVIIVENGKPTVPYSRRFPTLTLFHVETGKNIWRFFVDGDGSFYWIVPRGTYIISVITYHNPLSGRYVFQPQVVFRPCSERMPSTLGL